MRIHFVECDRYQVNLIQLFLFGSLYFSALACRSCFKVGQALQAISENYIQGLLVAAA